MGNQKKTCQGELQMVHTMFVEWFKLIAHVQPPLNSNCINAQDLLLNVFDKLKQLDNYANNSFQLQMKCKKNTCLIAVN